MNAIGPRNDFRRPGGTSSTVAAIDEVASTWVLRRDAGLDGASEREFAEWLAADSRHVEAFSRLAGTWAVFGRAKQKGAAEAIVTQLEIRGRKRQTRRRHLATATGAVALGMLLFQFWPQTVSRPSPILPPAATTASESIQKLPDGSVVELNTGARISVQFETGVRRVRLLEGEAHFRVEKDADRPFLVQAGVVEVRAVGTAFTVQLKPSAVEVIVTEGRVALDRAAVPAPALAAPPAAESILVASGNRALVDITPESSPAPQISSMTEAEIAARLAWRVPRLEFGGMDLAHAVALMNRHNRMQIILGDPSIGTLRVSGVFRSDNPEGFVSILEQTFGLRAEQKSAYELRLTLPLPE